MNGIKNLNNKQTVMLIFIIALGSFFFYSLSQTHLDYRTALFPGHGIGFGHNEELRISFLEFDFITTVPDHFVNIRFSPFLLDKTMPTHYVLIELPYEGILKDVSGKWKSIRTENSILIYREYICSDNKCEILSNGNDEIQFYFNKKLDSKTVSIHSVQLQFNNGLSNEAISFIYDNLIKDYHKHPIYGWDQETGIPTAVISIDGDAEITSGHEADQLFSTSKDNKNQKIKFNLNEQLFMHPSYEIPYERFLASLIPIIGLVEVPLIVFFINSIKKIVHTSSQIKVETKRSSFENLVLENEREKKQITPIIQIVNFGVEPPDPSNPQKTNYHPNLRNDGNVSVNNIRMYYKVMHRVVDLDDIVREKDEIRRQYIPYEGSIFPNGSARVNPIILEKTDKEISVVFWIDYDYGENESSAIIFNIQFQNFKNTRVTPYDHSVLSKAEQKWFDIKSGKGGAPI